MIGVVGNIFLVGEISKPLCGWIGVVTGVVGNIFWWVRYLNNWGTVSRLPADERMSR